MTESRLGESIMGGGLSDELKQATFSIGLKGVKPEDVPKVEELAISTLARAAAEGFPEDAIEASLNTVCATACHGVSRCVTVCDGECDGECDGGCGSRGLTQQGQAPDATQAGS